MIKLLPTIKLFQVVLTATGDLLVFLVAAVVVQLGVWIVQDGPALRVLHSITVTLVMHFAAPVGQKVKESKFWNRLDKVVFFLYVMWCLKQGDWILTCPDHPRVCRSLLFHSSSRSRHSRKQASYPASHTGSFFWTGWGPGSPRTGLKRNRQTQSEMYVHSSG